MRGAALLLATIAAIAAPSAGLADDASEIRASLEQWRTDYNAGNRDSICNLFAEDLVGDLQSAPSVSFTTLCDTLQEELLDAKRSISYDLDIKEIMVAGDIAIVRLSWTATERAGGSKTIERGLDVFRRQPDGAWRIVRLMMHKVP